MFVPINKIEKINGHTLPDNWFEACITDAWSPAWAFCTPEQAEFNAAHTTCPKCKGWGTERKGENVGCSNCHGTGSVRV